MALDPAGLKSHIDAIVADLKSHHRVIVKVDWKLSVDHDSKKVTGEKGLVVFDPRLETNVDALLVHWAQGTKDYEACDVFEFPHPKVTYFQITHAAEAQRPGKVSLEPEENESPEPSNEVDFDKFFVDRGWDYYINRAIEREDDRRAVLEPFFQLLESQGVNGYAVTGDSGPKVRQFECIKTWVKSCVDYGQGWDAPGGNMITLGNQIVDRMRDDIATAQKIPVEEVHQKLVVVNREHDKRGKVESEIVKQADKKKPGGGGAKTEHERKTTCLKCGMKGHYARSCYAGQAKVDAHQAKIQDFHSGGTRPASAKPSGKKTVTTY